MTALKVAAVALAGVWLLELALFAWSYRRQNRVLRGNGERTARK